jgi:hypothetical protein
MGKIILEVNIQLPWKECKEIDQSSFKLVRKHQRSVSAEHGILNPGKIFE